MSTREQEILDTLAALPCLHDITFHMALTDALMRHFGGERIASLMKSMGAEEEEFLSHPMITKSVRRAQEKVEKKVRREKEAESAEEWMRYNLEE